MIVLHLRLELTADIISSSHQNSIDYEEKVTRQPVATPRPKYKDRDQSSS